MKVKGSTTKLSKINETSTLVIMLEGGPFGPSFFQVDRIVNEKDDGYAAFVAGPAIDTCPNCEGPVLKPAKAVRKSTGLYHSECVIKDEEDAEESDEEEEEEPA